MLKISRESEINLINVLIDNDVISGKDLINIKKKSSEGNKSQIEAVFDLKLTDEKKILAFFSQVNPYEKEISKWFSNNLPALQSSVTQNQYEPWKHITHMSQFESLDDFFIYFNLFMSQTFVWKNKTYSRIPFQLSLKIVKTTTFTRFLKTK